MARTDDSVKIYTLGDYKCTNQNIVALRKILIEHQIQVVINQWGLPLVSCRVLHKAKKGLNVKTIAVYHNQVDTNARIKNVEIALEGCANPLKRSLLKLKKAAFKFVTSRSMRYVYHHTDIYQVLSASYIPLFSKFTGIKHPDHLMVQTNPVTLDSSDFSYSIDKKEKFEGFQQPKPYYERASILLLTSEYEGFPLVLAESMGFGVIPVVYNSYSAVGDIIDDKKNGLVIPYHKEGYRADEAANMLAKLMNDIRIRDVLASAAVEKSKEYSVERIYEQWMETLK